MVAWFSETRGLCKHCFVAFWNIAVTYEPEDAVNTAGKWKQDQQQKEKLLFISTLPLLVDGGTAG